MSIRSGSSVVGIKEHDVDVVIVGSGGGGAPAAFELASAGLDVLVLEAGPHVRPEEFSQRPLDSVRRTYVDKGGQETHDGSVLVLQGSCVGGSTVVNGEVCFRIPDEVLTEWTRDFGIEGIDPDTMAPIFAEVEEHIHATDEDGKHLDGSVLTMPGMVKLGLNPKPVKRNVKGCRGCNYCFFGCAYGCKQSMDQSYLPQGMAEGAKVISDARVECLTIDGNVVREVVARTPHGTLKVRAKSVVLACGAIATPLMLLDHQLGGPEVGKNLAVHPICAPFGWYPDAQPQRSSSMVGAYTDAFKEEGVLIESVSVPRDYLAAFIPGIGREHRDLARNIDHVATMGAVVRDTGGLGRVARDRNGKKRITWKLDHATERKVRTGMRRVAEIHFAAGATKVTLPSLDVVTIQRGESLSPIDQLPLGAADITFVSYHPQGTAPLGLVTDQNARVKGTDNLYVMDTSLFPSPVGVNTQVPVMAIATLMARRLADQMS